MAASSRSTQSAPPVNISFERERGVYAIEIMRDVAHAVIEVGKDDDRTARILKVFSTLAHADVPVFLIKMHSGAVTLAFSGVDRKKALDALAAENLKSDVRGELALLVVRAASMRDLHGVMVNIADALFAAGARLYEAGDSHNSVQCLIEADRTSDAAAQLCAVFQLPPEAVHQSVVGVEAGR
jgi:aspartokinase